MDKQKITGCVLLLLVVAFEVAVTAYLILDRRIMLGHDGFEMLSHQWYFLNSKVSHGEFPLWTPYMAHGVPMWWFFIYSRMEIFLNALMLFSEHLKGMNFLPFFWGGLFFDKLVLLVGVWLLAKRYFSSNATVFFVASTVMATTITYTQVSFPLYLFHSIPLMVYLLHRFFDTFQWKWLFLAAFFFSVVSINIYNFVPVITLAVFLYFLVYYFSSGKNLFAHMKIEKSDMLWVAALVGVVLVMAGVFFIGHDPLMHINTISRGTDGAVSLDVFLSYGGRTNLFKWWELFLGISPQIDYTVYMGLLSLPLVLIGGIYSKNLYKYPIIFGALFFILFACATPVSALTYYIWPLMKLFRHIGLIAPLIKFYFCFLAGFGFEYLFDPHKSGNSKDISQKSFLAAGILLLNGVFLCQLMINPEAAEFMVAHIGDSINSALRANLSKEFLVDTLHYMEIFSFFIGILVLLRPIVKFSKYAPLFIFLLMVFHLTDVYWYAFQQIQMRSFSLTEKQAKLLDFQKAPFVPRRYQSNNIPNPRESFMIVFQGAICNSIYNFTFSDLVKTKFRSDFCLMPFDKLSKSFNGKTLSPVLLKLTGTTQDKVQLFSSATPMYDFPTMTKAIQNKDYAGDRLFYLSPDQKGLQSQRHWKELNLVENQRLDIPYQVLSFSPNQITISVDTGEHQGAWLQYCDVWHENWKAQVNGKLKDLFIGNLAYKAVALDKGKNIVHFYIESQPIQWLYYFFAIASLIWIILLIWLLFE